MQSVCLMIMSYKFVVVENLVAPWSSGAWDPGPNGPVVDPPQSMDNREHLSRTDSGMKRDKARRSILQRKAKMANDATLGGMGWNRRRRIRIL